MFARYAAQAQAAALARLLAAPDPLLHYALTVDFLKLFEIHPDIGDDILCNPVGALKSCDEALIEAQKLLLECDQYKDEITEISSCTVKHNVHARFFGLPVCPELHRTVFPKNTDVGCFLKVTGTVVRVTQSKMLEYRRIYVCAKCKHENVIEAKFEERYILKQPPKCTNDSIGCKSSTFIQINLVSREHCKDYQELKIQEQVNKLSIGTIPGSMWVTLEDDLVDCCKPGDDLNICGTVLRRWRPSATSKKSEVELVLRANYVEVCNSQKSQVISNAPDVKECFDEFWSKFEGCPLKGRDYILASVCPQVYGLHLVKLALLLTVITGSNNIMEKSDNKTSSDDKHKVNVRGQCHLLLVGDPGTGKSQLLRAGAELTPRSVFTTGTGSTRAGLTCAALREDGEWQLEAGALVLSDGGVCCIDEIGQLREHDRTSIHEAMEQQTISIAKAGIVCKLNTRCAVIGACNPKGHYQIDQPLSVNVSLGTPLLSRFDLIFILLDSKNQNWDKLVSSYILFGNSSNSNSSKAKQWNIEKLQMYIGLVGPRSTQISQSANTILQTYYMMQRKSEVRDPSRTTVRMLDSLVRLSQAHSRLMYRDTVLPTDAITAISLVDLSMQDCTLRDTETALHSTFPKYPDFQYLVTAKKLLSRMNLYEIWNQELLYYSKLLKVDHKTLGDEIDKESYRLFMRYDDVKDDNVPLSCSLVTSSYFHNNEEQNNRQQNVKEKHVNENDGGKEINAKLAATLKKHSSMNKTDILPNGKVSKKRKKVTVDSKVVLETKRKKYRIKARQNDKVNKNIPGTKKGKRKRTESVSDDDIVDPVNVLNCVPSVNDIFVDMSIDLNCDHEVTNDTSPVETVESIENHIKKSTFVNINHDHLVCGNSQISENKSFVNNKTADENISINNEPNTKSIECKLKKFQFIQKRDLNKLYEPSTSKHEPAVDTFTKTKSVDNISTLLDSKKSLSNKSERNSITSSQISMFESSDCEVDLDL